MIQPATLFFARTPSRTLLISIVALIACSSPDATIAPAGLALSVDPTVAQLAQGTSATVTATVRTSGSYHGSANVTVTGAPEGVTITVSDIQQVDRVITASIRLDVGLSSPLGTYVLIIHGTTTAVAEATARLTLTVTDAPALCPPGPGRCDQWAIQATASSQYSTSEWSAAQAIGVPNVPGCADDVRAWASIDQNGVDWLQVTFTHAVVPSEVRIYENWAPSSIESVEVRDESGTYHPVYTSKAGVHHCPRVLVIPISDISVAVNAVRISLDQRALNDWNEIDAVRLIGIR